MGQVGTIYLKDPQAVLDYKIDLADWLQPAETITLVTATASVGLTVDSTSSDATGAIAWVSGGTHGENYELTISWQTNQGRTDEQTLLILCRNK